MEQVTEEIKKVANQIDAIEELLEKDHTELTTTEINKFGNHEQLREKETEHLRQKNLLLELQQRQDVSSRMTAGTAIDNSTVIRTPFQMLDLYTNEGVPGDFRTLRQETLAQFYDLLFPSQGPYRSVIFIKAPPCSGKTGFSQLLCQLLRQDPKRSVVLLSCLDLIDPNIDFESCFGRIVGHSLDSFLSQANERVMIVDSAQCSFTDEYFWRAIVKQALKCTSFPPGLRIVLLSTFGSYNPARDACTPIAIPINNCFGLYSSPGLNLQFAEFKEMASGSWLESYVDIIWKVCSNHIGVASTILRYLDTNLGSLGNISVDQLQSTLYSKDLLQALARDRGMPSLYYFSELVAHSCDLTVEDVAKMKDVLHRVSAGEILELADEVRSPGNTKAVDLLVMCGFLFVDEKDIIRFASQMHLKVWLNSNRKDCVGWFNSITLFDFISMAIGRMHSVHLSTCHKQNSGDDLERKVQMELYAAIVSFCPRNVYVTPEWRTADKKGYVGIVVQFLTNQDQSTMWFLELLVDGVEAKEHAVGFDPAGKRQSSLNYNSQYALIDFRQNVAARDFKEKFIRVSFSGSFGTATLKSDQDSKTVSLLS